MPRVLSQLSVAFLPIVICWVAQQAMHLSATQRQHLLEMRSALFTQMELIVQQRRRIIAELEVGSLTADTLTHIGYSGGAMPCCTLHASA